MTVNRFVLDERPTFADVLRESRQACLTGMNHAGVEFDRLVETLNIPRSTSRHPAFDYVFAYQNIDMPAAASASHRLAVADFDYRISRFDMFLSVMRVDADLRVLLEYSTALFDPETAEAFLSDFLTTFRLALDDPDIALASLPASRSRSRLPAEPMVAPEFTF